VVPEIECIETRDNYGRFIAEPLERGFSITLGNALRRMLLGSLLGAAVNWAKIEGIQHEFSTIPHVKEDVMEFLLNVKTLRLRPLTKLPGKLFLEVEREGYVCAADIKPSADFDIANPELHLATLDSDEARLYVEFNVILGKGYVPATHSDGLPIGVIPVDAIFTPVRKVNYSTEPTRVGQQTGYEKLLLDVWTDGTISPAEAVSQSAQLLIEQLSVFSALVLDSRKEIEERLAGLPISIEQYNMPLEQIGFSPRVFNCLRRNKITKMGELIEMSVKELLLLEKMGQKSVDEVQQRLEEMGLTLKGSEKKAEPEITSALFEIENEEQGMGNEVPIDKDDYAT
jgi:DNA-directed RNA polymerase subunit alpha